MTSPNKSKRKVTTTTCTMNLTFGSATSPMMLSVIKVDKITIEIFAKLLEINMVASNRFGFSNNASNNLFELFLSFSMDSLSVGLREKKATSDPEINAEHKSKISMASEAPINLIEPPRLALCVRRIRTEICSKGSSKSSGFNEQ